jgi:hypothetical protein
MLVQFEMDHMRLSLHEARQQHLHLVLAVVGRLLRCFLVLKDQRHRRDVAKIFPGRIFTCIPQRW